MTNLNFTRRDFLKTLGLGAAGLMLPGCLGSRRNLFGGDSKNMPNIIFILADDLGYGDLGCYGATKLQTPNIDQLAKEGVLFTDAHSSASVCSPTRYSVLTGRYCWRTRLKKGVCMPNDPLLIEKGRTTAASMLKSIGYTTGCVGKWHLGFGEQKPDWNGLLKPGPLEVGFDYYFGVPVSNNWPPFVYVENHKVVDRKPNENIRVEGTSERKQPIPPKRIHEEIALVQTRKAIEFIERSKDKPFFLYFPTCNIHLPHTPNKRFQYTSQAGAYGDFVHELDWTVGQVLKTLQKLNLTENTLLILTSDNGGRTREVSKFGHHACGNLRGQKGDIYEGGHRVPFIARWPGKTKPDSTCKELICLSDMLATFAAIVGVELDDNTGEDSYNILPLLLGRKSEHHIRDTIVHHSAHGIFAIRQGKWKLALGRGSGGISIPQLIEPKEGEPPGELYNLANDPAEKNNLWAQYPEIVKRLTELLEKYKTQGHSRPLI